MKLLQGQHAAVVVICGIPVPSLIKSCGAASNMVMQTRTHLAFMATYAKMAQLGLFCPVTPGPRLGPGGNSTLAISDWSHSETIHKSEDVKKAARL